MCTQIGRNSRIAIEVWLDDQDAPTSAMPTAKTPVCLKVQAIYPAYGFDQHFTASNLTFRRDLQLRRHSVAVLTDLGHARRTQDCAQSAPLTRRQDGG